MRNIATALAAVLAAFMFTGCASAPERHGMALAAAAPEADEPANSCRQSGRTTMVRGDCAVDWDGQTVRVSGTCNVTPGTSSQGSCLRLQVEAAQPGCTGPWGSLTCTGLDAALLKNGDLHVHGGMACETGHFEGNLHVGSSVVCR